MKASHEPDEAETHYKHHSRGDLQARSVIRVETQHVAVSTPHGATTTTTTAGGRGSPPPQP